MDQISAPETPQQRPAAPDTGSVSLIAALVLAVVACQLCISMPTPALPDIAARLNTDTAVIGLAQALFFMLGGLLSVILAAYSDYGRTRRLIATALVLGILGSLVAAIAPTVAVFILGRTMQSATTAVFPLALRVLRQTVTPRQFGKAMGVITAANGGIVGLDGLASGWLTSNFGFRSVFLAMAGFGVLTMVVLLRWVPDVASTASGRLDWRGLLLLSLGLACVELGLGAASSAPIGVVAGLVGGGLVLFVVFWAVEQRVRDPLVPTEYLNSRQTWPVLLTSALVTAGLLSTINFIIPVFSQNHHGGFGMSATASAVLFIVPVCLVNVIFAPVVGMLSARIGWRRMLRWSMVLTIPVPVALGLGIESEWFVAIMVVLIGFGLAGSMTPLNGLSALLAAPENPSVLPGLNSAAYGVGSSLGLVLAGQLLASDGNGHAGTQHAMWMVAGLIAVGFLTSLLIADRTGTRGGRI